MTEEIYDLLIIGGGVNGCGVARDAAGRGLSVCLVEKEDLGWATSSTSTKLFHGGLRYLEYFEFRLVRSALEERETLLKAMPHISWPIRFVLPVNPDLRFKDDHSRLGKLLAWVPFLVGRRPALLTRLGLFVYDHLGGRKILPSTQTLNLRTHDAGATLKPKFQKGFEYSDCWIEDARLVSLNARDAAEKGAVIRTRTSCTAATREGGLWSVDLGGRVVKARGLINAGGPWVSQILSGALRQNHKAGIRLVRGSHIVTRKLFDHDQAYFFQLADGRIIFAIPYETDFTLIGTTDADHSDPDSKAECSVEERDYLLSAASNFFEKPVTAEDIVWTYAGVRPLYDDGATSATAATRDYVLDVSDEDGAAPLINIFGGKITTYRKLAERCVDKLVPYFDALPGPWTAGAPLPGGDFPVDGVVALIERLMLSYPFLTDRWARRLVKAYGEDAFDMLGDAHQVEDLGRDFGATLTEAEVTWLKTHEFAQTADDILWRRSKIGLRMTEDEKRALSEWCDETG